MSTWAILTDVTKCIGCENCVAACKKINHTGEDRPWRWQKSIESLSASRWTTIVKKPDHHFIRKQCRHCLSPACVSVCPVGAMKKTPEGPVIYDSKLCIGCRYCMMSCPFGIPRYTWADPTPYVRKCIMCYQKIESGEIKEPACIKACPTQATIFGDRDELLAEARKRISEKPDKYMHRIWGEHEVGGTSVLYVSDISLDFLSWDKELPREPLPGRVFDVLEKVPKIFVGMGAVMYGFYWIIERRERLMNKDKGGPDKPDASGKPDKSDRSDRGDRP